MMSLSLSVDSKILAPNIGFDTGNAFFLKPLYLKESNNENHHGVTHP